MSSSDTITQGKWSPVVKHGSADHRNADGDYVPDPRRWQALSVCLVAGFMTLLDISIINVALPSILSGLPASESDLQWVVSGYALVFGLLLVPAGRAGDLYGRRTVFIGGLVLFTLASAACGVAPSAGWLVLTRLLQGVAAGIMTPQIAGFVQQLFRGAERGKAFGLLGATIGVSTAVGPLAGGALIALFGAEHGWRAVFFVNVPVGIVAVGLALRLLPRPAHGGRRESLDLVGVVLLGLGVFTLLLPLVEKRMWPGTGMWLLMVAAAVILAAFVGWEWRYARRGRAPLVDLSLFRTRSYGLGTWLITVFFVGFTVLFFVLALFLQIGHGYSALESGLSLTPFALGSAASAVIGGRVVTRVGRPLVAVGLLLMILGLLLTVLAIEVAGGHHVGLVMTVPLLIAGLGSGLVISPNFALTLAEVPVSRAGSAGGVVQTGQRIGGAVGVAAVGSWFFTRLSTTGGDWDTTTQDALWLCGGIVTLALVLALVDVRVSSKVQRASTLHGF